MISERIRADMIAAMKAKDALRVSTLRGVLAAFTNELVAKGMKPTEQISDDLALSVLKRLVKQRAEAQQQYTAGNRPELAEKEEKERAMLDPYLPEGASTEEIERVARAKKEELGIEDQSGLGSLVGAVMKEMRGTADGAAVKEVVRKILQ